MSEPVEAERKAQVKAVLSFTLILGIIVFTVLGMILLILNRRVAKEEKKDRIVPAVEVIEVAEAAHLVRLESQGVVESSRETKLAAEVAGRVMEISPAFRRGGRVKEGECLVRLDPSDYRAALAAAEVRLADAKLALEQERARVDQARLDWAKLGKGSQPLNPLVLRQPFLDAAEAMVVARMEEAAKARRDVERTEILAPFDAGVRMNAVEVGAVLAPGTIVAELYATHDLEVRLPLSLEDFGFLERDPNGQVKGRITLHGRIGAQDYTWQAEPARVDPEISREMLSAHLSVKILPSPGTAFPLPPVGLFVTAKITGQTLHGIREIPRRALIEGQRVIIVGPDRRISFRDLEIPRLTRESALVSSGLSPGDRVLLTRLNAAVAGMEVDAQAESVKGQE